MAPNHIHIDVPGGVPLKMWARRVPVEPEAIPQLSKVVRLPIVFRHIAATPDVHVGIGAHGGRGHCDARGRHSIRGGGGHRGACLHHAQGRRAGTPGADDGCHSRQHGRAQLHRARQGPSRGFRELPHGAGRIRSRTEVRDRFTRADHRAATEGIACRQDRDVIDEAPAAHKDIGAVMAAQSDPVAVVHTLRQVVCVKG